MDHRKKHIRPISREANIAYGFLRGTLYAKIEPNVKTQPDWLAVDKNCMNFGDIAKKYDRIPDPNNPGRTNFKWSSPYTEDLLIWKLALTPEQLQAALAEQLIADLEI